MGISSDAVARNAGSFILDVPAFVVNRYKLIWEL
jgi:hypothetical protein